MPSVRRGTAPTAWEG